jgi:hypothetical protein
MKAVLALPGRDRYDHFIKQAADKQRVWSLRDAGGWVFSTGDERTSLLPLRPHPDYASLAATDEWTGAIPDAIGLNELLNEMLPVLAERGVGVLVFPTPEGEGVVPPLEQFISDLQAELDRF